ncbi:MAG: hypothetical protein ABJD07_07855, partial [Gemmatimonadaceae bacterium]
MTSYLVIGTMRGRRWPARLLGIMVALASALRPSVTLVAQQHTERVVRGMGSDPARATELVILGVDHSAQLVARAYHPGYLRAFFDRVQPAAICIERAPDEFARGDFYEFTYEQQYVAVPYARAHGIEICPVDWLPSRDDERLAFGRMEVVDPPAVRQPNGFQGFLAMDSTSLRRTLFYADSEPTRGETRAFFDAPRAAGWRDFPRRLDLYRTFMQAMRIRAAARAHPGQRVLVVVGSMHKDDLEHVLAGDPAIHLVQPSTFGLPDSSQADAQLAAEDLAAIASFNLLGAQPTEGPIDWAWVAAALDRFERLRGTTSPEVRLLRTRYAVLTRSLSAANAAAAYERIAQDADSAARFTFTGVQDTRRVDSYYDPFGNLTIRQRAQLETAREWVRAGHADAARRVGAQLKRDAHWSALGSAE